MPTSEELDAMFEASRSGLCFHDEPWADDETPVLCDLCGEVCFEDGRVHKDCADYERFLADQ